MSSLAADDVELTCSVLLLGTTLASTEQTSSSMKAGLHSALKGTTVMDSILWTDCEPFTAQNANGKLFAEVQ